MPIGLPRRGLVGAMVLGWPFMAGPARAEIPPHVPRMLSPEVGESWAYRKTVTGGPTPFVNDVVFQRLADLEFSSVTSVAIFSEITTQIYAPSGEMIAILRNGKAVFRYIPPAPAYIFPLKIGSHWEFKGSVINLTNNQRLDFQSSGSIEAYETVVVPAGAFMAFRRRAETLWLTGQRTIGMEWWAPSISNAAKLTRVENRPNGSVVSTESVLIRAPAIA